MDKNIFEEGPRRGHAAGDTSIEQQASQLASDIRYKARQKMKGKSGSNLSPGQVQQLYRQLLNSSPAPGGVKAIVKKKLFGEQIDPGIVPVTEHLKSSSGYVFGRVFEGKEERKFVIRVTDRATGNTTYRKADRAKIAELRANKNISSVEITGRKEVDDAFKGDPKPNYGGKKAKKDYDGDGKVESGSKEHAGVVHNAIQRKKGGVADGQDTRKEETLHEDEYRRMLAKERKAEKERESKRGGVKSITPGKYADSTGKNYADSQMGFHKKVTGKTTTTEEVIYEKEDKGDKKLDVMKGKNKVNTSPTIGESIRAELDALKSQRLEEQEAAAKAAGPSPEERKQLMNKDKMLKKKIMLQKQTMQMQKQGRLPLNYSESCDTCEKCGKSPCECPKKEGEVKAMDPREVPTRINLAKNKLRAMGLKMSYDMEGEMTEAVYGGIPKKKEPKDTRQMVTRADKLGNTVAYQNYKKGDKRYKAADHLGEASEDRMRDQRQERGGIDGNVDYSRPAKNVSSGKKKSSEEVRKLQQKAVDMVRAKMTAKYGKGAIK